MRKVIQLSLEEFAEEINKNHNWEDLPIGTIYLDKDKIEAWIAVPLAYERNFF